MSHLTATHLKHAVTTAFATIICIAALATQHIKGVLM